MPSLILTEGMAARYRDKNKVRLSRQLSEDNIKHCEYCTSKAHENEVTTFTKNLKPINFKTL